MIQNTIDWYNGEIAEGKYILGFGAFLLLTTFLLYFFGTTPGAKALQLPLLIIGIFFAITGGTMVYSNSKKIQQVEENYQQHSEAYFKMEMKRVEDFQYLYPLSVAVSLVCFAIAVLLFYFAKNMNLHAIAISLILFGSAFAVIDYFSKERATIYYEKLQSNSLEK